MAIALGCLGVIFLGAFVFVYHQSLYHVARSDQLSYLSALGLTHDWYSLAVSTFDLNRKSWFPAGDAGLFRPVLYFLLGNERYFFEYDYFYWQLTGLVLHVIACLLLFKVLWRIVPGFGALFFTVFFAFQFSNLETIIWHHINAYILFTIFILLAMDHFLRWTKEGGLSNKIFPMLVLLTLACFTYEVGLWYCVCFAIMMRSWRLLLPVWIYAMASISNAFYNTGVFAGGIPGNGLHVYDCLNYFLMTVKWFICAGLFLAPEDMVFAPRLEVRNDFLIWGGISGAWSPGDILALCVILLVGFAVWRRHRLFKLNGKLQALILLMLSGYILIIVLGRVANRGLNAGLSNTVYYLYNFWVLAVIGMFALFQTYHRWKLLFITVLLVLSVYNAMNIHRMNSYMSNAFREERVFVTFIRGFVHQHQGEHGLSFTVSEHCPGHYAQMVLAHDGKTQKKLTFAQLLYPQYYNEKEPKYIIGAER